MQDKGLPVLGQPARIGNPWHGTVTGTTLTLKSNGATMPWPNTIGLSQYRTTIDPLSGLPREFWEADRYGFTSRIKFAGGVGATNPDVTSGKHWLEEAVLSGPRHQLYGQNLDGWIWQRADGSKWWVTSDLDEITSHLWTTSVTINFTFKPFGNFTQPAPPSNQTASVTITDHGQSEAQFPPFPTIIGIDYPDTADHYRKVWLTVVDISSTGRYAILEVSSPDLVGGGVNWVDDPANHHPSSYERCVLAYLQIDLGAPDLGTPVPASVSVIKRRENIYGTDQMHTISDLPDYRGRIMRACFDRNDSIVYLEYRVSLPNVQNMTASWVRVNSAGVDMDSISLSLSDTTATARVCNYPTKYENYAALSSSGNSKIIQCWLWSNNLVGFAFVDGPSGTQFIYSGKLMTADGPVTVANKPYDYNAQTFGSYSACYQLGGLGARVYFGSSAPVCWV